MANDDMDRVVPLGQLDDFRVAQGAPDVRGWEVRASDGRTIGEVDELLVDTRAMKVRYLDVEVADSVLAGRPDRHVLIPIGYARLEHDCVIVDRVASADLGGIPSYGQGPLTRDFETSVRDSFSARELGRGALSGEGGMMDTARLDGTPGTGTVVGGGLSGTGGGMRASAELDTASSVHATGSSAGMTAAGDDGLGGARTSAGSQGPAGGLERETMRRDASHGTGLAGSDYQHHADEEFYATDAFDDQRFYGRGTDASRYDSPNTAQRGSMGLSQGTGAEGVDMLRGSGLPRDGGNSGKDGVGADREETRQLAREGRELLREDHQNRGVDGGGHP